MKTPLEPYVIEFLQSRGYKYFLSETITCNDKLPKILLKPCKNKLDEDKANGSYIFIENRDYVTTNKGRKEWMWANIPDDELANLRKWQIIHSASLQPSCTE